MSNPLPDALAHMAQQGMTDLSCWYSQDRDGNAAWHASCKIDERRCHVAHDNNPVDAMLEALRLAWEDAPNRKGPIK